MPHATDEEQQTSEGRSISSAVATSSQTNTGSTVAFTTSQTASSGNEFASEAQVSCDCRRPFGVKERGNSFWILLQRRQAFYDSLSDAERKAFDEGAYCGW